MKILFGAGNTSGSNLMVSRFLKHIKYETRIAAYYRNSDCLKTIDYILDPLLNLNHREKNYFKDKFGLTGPHVHYPIADLIINDLIDWSPDLIISDCEFFTAAVAKAMEIPLYYCSPLLQVFSISNNEQFRNLKIYITELPKADKYLVYSPIPNLNISRDYLQVFPYTEDCIQTPTLKEKDIVKRGLPEEVEIITGETSFIADCICSDRTFVVSPDHKDVEQVVNAILCEQYGVAKNIGRSNNIEYLLNQAEKIIPLPFFDLCDIPTLEKFL